MQGQNVAKKRREAACGETWKQQGDQHPKWLTLRLVPLHVQKPQAEKQSNRL
jgi:hypothetical protein